MRTKQLEPLLGGWVQSQQRRERRPLARQNHSTSSAERGEDVCLQTICNARRALEQTRKETLAAQRQARLDVAGMPLECVSDGSNDLTG